MRPRTSSEVPFCLASPVTTVDVKRGLARVLEVGESDGLQGRSEGEFPGKRVMLAETFIAHIRDHFHPRAVEVKFWEDSSGVEYVRVENGGGTFELFTEYTEPTLSELIEVVFSREPDYGVEGVAMREAYIVTEQGRRKKLREICIRYGFPENSIPALWRAIGRDGEKVERALEEWNHWLQGKCPISLIC